MAGEVGVCIGEVHARKMGQDGEVRQHKETGKNASEGLLLKRKEGLLSLIVTLALQHRMHARTYTPTQADVPLEQRDLTVPK